MWERLRSIWTVPDLRNKILFTLGILLLTRVLANIPVPLTQTEQSALRALFSNPNSNGNLGQIFGLLDVFSGGNLQHFSIIAMGVYPYITATIVMQLLQPIIPALQNLSQEGEAGRLRFSQITRLIAVPLAFLQALGYIAIFVNANVLDPATFNLFGPNWLQALAILVSLTAGTMILVWLGELITENGIGNGISLIIFAGIVSGLPGYIKQGQRRVPVQYPTKRVVGRGLLVGSAQTTYIPMQVNSAGMIPLIFAQSMLIFPEVLSRYLASSNTPWLKDSALWIATYLVNPSLWWYALALGTLVVLFTFFYATVLWQQQNIPENLQKQGAFIPGYRPGEPTRKHMEGILYRITLGGALFLGIVAALPYITRVGGNQLLSSTAILIVVGVVLDTVKQLEAQMVMRNYSGFLS